MNVFSRDNSAAKISIVQDVGRKWKCDASLCQGQSISSNFLHMKAPLWGRRLCGTGQSAQSCP